MPDSLSTDQLFFGESDLESGDVCHLVGETLSGADDGELFLEARQSEALVLDDGRLKSASYDSASGFGFRGVAGEATAYAHASELSMARLREAAETVRAVTAGYAGEMSLAPRKTNQALYRADNPLDDFDLTTKVRVLSEIDGYARRSDERIRQVIASLAASWQAVRIIRPDGTNVSDIRPLVRLNVTVMVDQNGRQETGSYGLGARAGWKRFLEEDTWQQATDEAVRQALVNLDAQPAPAGEMTVVLGPGWPGILLHEAIGHGLEGDFNRKKTSAFSGLMGERVAAPGVTVVDDGTIPDRRGSLTVDDEGTPSERTVLIEDGILKGFIQDRMNARLMGVGPTGNGRRQSFAHKPMPRMTNTYMLGGGHDPKEIIASVDKGLYAVSFGGGQVDITSGKFVFSCTEAYRIENGKIGAPLKGATLIGNGPDVLTRVSMIGNDMALDPGIGSCGKDGQLVPVGVGQPTMRIENLTVGGTAV
ncbi:MAG: metalloprotease TldD [Hyphomicrobiales bacterium]|nr:metalloprotease TldD [Hyphomicrobiales bacterium]